jgi:hypothetical protein
MLSRGNGVKDDLDPFSTPPRTIREGMSVRDTEKLTKMGFA